MEEIDNLAIFLYLYIWLSIRCEYYSGDCQRQSCRAFGVADDFCKEIDVEIETQSQQFTCLAVLFLE